MWLPSPLARALEFGGNGMPWAPGVASPPYHELGSAGGFLTSEERDAVDAISARIIPSDDDGPGARDANVVEFIDRQLAGFYGEGRRWYMSGPFPEPEATQGYQGPYPPAELWRRGIAELNAHCRQAYDGRSFAELEPEEQDAVLTGIEEEEISFDEISATQFFSFAREMTIEGFFCDPIYGGNRDMIGWQYVGFPGARYDYRPFLDHGGRPIDIAPVSLVGRPGWNIE